MCRLWWATRSARDRTAREGPRCEAAQSACRHDWSTEASPVMFLVGNRVGFLPIVEAFCDLHDKRTVEQRRLDAECVLCAYAIYRSARQQIAASQPRLLAARAEHARYSGVDPPCLRPRGACRRRARAHTHGHARPRAAARTTDGRGGVARSCGARRKRRTKRRLRTGRERASSRSRPLCASSAILRVMTRLSVLLSWAAAPFRSCWGICCPAVPAAVLCCAQ